MTYHEKKTITSLISTIIITAAYTWYVYGWIQGGEPGLIHDFSFWGKAMLIFIPVGMVGKILTHILFIIFYRLSTQEEEPSFEDERDKLIELKSTRNSHYTFLVAFLFAMIALTIGWPGYSMFLILAAGGFISSMVEDFSQLYFYRRGF